VCRHSQTYQDFGLKPSTTTATAAASPTHAKKEKPVHPKPHGAATLDRLNADRCAALRCAAHSDRCEKAWGVLEYSLRPLRLIAFAPIGALRFGGLLCLGIA
jgi:hypothetical protein